MGRRGTLWGAACALLIARASGAEPAAEEPEVRAPITGTQPLVTPASTFTATDDGIEQLTGDTESFPDVVLIGGDDSFYCTGVLIDARHVLTAGHCGAATRIAFGNSLPSVTSARVARRTRHPRLDVALLTLDRPAKVQAHARRREGEASPATGVLRILGFGVRDRLRLTGFGTKRQLDVGVDGWGCTTARAAALGCSPGDELVIRGGSGNDTCLGDSGGPVFEFVDDGWQLVAITSRGMRPRKVICGEGGIYVRVDRIARWIEEETRI